MKVMKYSSKDFIHRVSCWSLQSATASVSEFDDLLCKMWDDAQAKGYFRYTLDNLRTKILPGEYEFVAQLNIKRAVQRRKPQEFSSVSQPFNPAEFNFTKVARHEILFGVYNKDKDVFECNDIGEENGLSVDTNPEHIMVINVSPLEYGNCLFVPDVNSCLPQILTCNSIQMGIELVLLSSTIAFRVGFNSLCANASVNHHHLHVFYLHHKLKIETINVKHLIDDCYALVDFPSKGFAFCLTNLGIPKLSRSVYKLTSLLQSSGYAHNMFITRGSTFDSKDCNVYDSVRVFIWARRPVYGAKDDTAFNVACCELAGHLPIKNSEAFETITEDGVVRLLQEACDEAFEEVCPSIINLFSEK